MLRRPRRQDAFVKQLPEGIEAEERRIDADLSEKGHVYPSGQQLQRASTKKRSQSYEQRRACNPQIACRDRKTRIALLEELTLLRRAYTAARELWLEGGDEVVEFPHGTYQLRGHPRVKVAPPL